MVWQKRRGRLLVCRVNGEEGRREGEREREREGEFYEAEGGDIRD